MTSKVFLAENNLTRLTNSPKTSRVINIKRKSPLLQQRRLFRKNSVPYNSFKAAKPWTRISREFLALAVSTGFEPAISALTGPHVKPLHHETNRTSDSLAQGGGAVKRFVSVK